MRELFFHRTRKLLQARKKTIFALSHSLEVCIYDHAIRARVHLGLNRGRRGRSVRYSRSKCFAASAVGFTIYHPKFMLPSAWSFRFARSIPRVLVCLTVKEIPILFLIDNHAVWLKENRSQSWISVCVYLDCYYLFRIYIPDRNQPNTGFRITSSPAQLGRKQVNTRPHRNLALYIYFRYYTRSHTPQLVWYSTFRP